MRLLFTLCLFTLFQCASKKKAIPIVEGNPYKKEIEEKLDFFLNKVQMNDYEAIVDATYPKLFEITPREELIKMMKTAFESEEMEIKIGDAEILKIHDKLVSRSDTLYCLVDYKSKITMKLGGEMAEAKDFMIPVFEEQFGKENVSYDSENSTFAIKANNQMIAIREVGVWYFLENQNKPDERFVLEKTIGIPILKELGI